MTFRITIFLVSMTVLATSVLLGCGTTQQDITPTVVQEKMDLSPDKNSGLSTFSQQRASYSLLFLGTRHTFDAKDPQVADIKRLFFKFRPTLVLIEGGDWDVAANEEAAVRAGGEMSFARYLSSTLGVKAVSLEPNFDEEIAAMLQSHKAVDVKLYYALRMISQFRRQQAAISLVEQMNQLLSVHAPRGLPKLDVSPRNVDELDALLKKRFPNLSNWENVDPWTDGRFPVEADGVALLDAVAKSSATYRNRHMATLIKAHSSKGNRVLVITGVSHLAALMPLL
jgi:hypothetical protein